MIKALKKLLFSYRSREIGLDAFEVGHVETRCKLAPGDRAGNRQKERGLRNTVKEECYFLLTATACFSLTFHSPHGSKCDLLKGYTVMSFLCV
jgi:hypothetical protein